MAAIELCLQPGYLILEVFGTASYYERDDYYKRTNRIVTSASVLKMLTSARRMAAQVVMTRNCSEVSVVATCGLESWCSDCYTAFLSDQAICDSALNTGCCSFCNWELAIRKFVGQYPTCGD